MRSCILFALCSCVWAQTIQESNKAAARRFFEKVWFEQNVDEADSIFAPEFVSHDPRAPQPLKDKPESIKAVVSQWKQSTAEMGGRIDDMVAEGDRVVARWTWRVKLKSWYQRFLAGRDLVETPVIQIFRFENGKVVEVWNYRDDQGLQDALGSFKLSYMEGFLLGVVSTLILGKIIRRRPKPTTVALAILLLSTLAPSAFADHITMNNGDRLSGTVLKTDTKTLTFKSELAGAVTIPWEAVATIDSSASLNVGLKGGEVLVGSVTARGGRLQVQTTDSGLVTAAKENVTYLRSKDEEAAYQLQLERLRNPSLLDLWTGFLDLGYAASRGNARTTTFTMGMNAARVTPRDKISTHFTSLYSRNKTTGVSIAAANAIRGGIRYDVNLAAKLFSFGFTDLEFDEFQKLDLRFVGGAGFGYRVIRSERTNFDVFGGGALNKEFFQNNVRRTSGETMFGEEFVQKLTRATQIRERWVIFPNLSNSGEFRMQFDASAVTALGRWLAWQISLSDRYLSNPLPGTKSNDVLFTTGIRFTFAR